jgi:hypothetical protein
MVKILGCLDVLEQPLSQGCKEVGILLLLHVVLI